MTTSDNSASAQMRSYDRNQCVVFLKTKEAFGGLSNMAGGFPLRVNGVRIFTSEALYQACRFPHLPNVQRIVLGEPSPMTSKMKGKPYRKDSRPDWDQVRVRIMRWCLRVKLAQNWKTFGELLLATDDKPIVEESRKDDFWGANPVDEHTLVGMNVLGRLLMELREEFKSDRRDTLLRVAPLQIPDFLLMGQPIATIEALAQASKQFAPGTDASAMSDQPNQLDEIAAVAPMHELHESMPQTYAKSYAAITDLKPYPEYKDTGLPWLGRVPMHWEVKRLGALLRERGEKNDRGQITEVLSLLRERGVIPYGEKGRVGNKKSDDITRYKVVRPDDVVVNCMNVIIGSVGISRYTGCLSPVYYVLTRRFEDDNPHYLNAYFQTKSFQLSLVRIGNGILSHRMRIPMELLKCELFPRPTAEEQAAIVRFLDHVTHRLDKAIRAKRKTIALLNEQKQAIIHRAFTRGLNPNVPLKDSGIPWLGQIPAHWEVKPLGTFTNYISYGFTNPIPSTDRGPYMLTAADIAKGKIQYGTARHTSEDAFRFLLTDKSRPRAGDILITKDGTLGRVAIADGEQVCINQSVALLRIASERISREFIADALQAEGYQQMMIFNAGGTTIKHIYITRLVKMKMALPPVREQKAIAADIRRTKLDFEKVIGRIEREIELLREYRTRLIADVVTGKLDVRKAAARLPEVEEVPAVEQELEETEDELADEEA